MRMRALVSVVAAVAVSASSLLVAVMGPTVDPAPAPPPLSDEERLALYDGTLDAAWSSFYGIEYPGLPRPAIDSIRVLPLSERNDVVKRCLEDAGFTITVTDQGYAYESSGGEQAAIDRFVCEAGHPDEGSFEILMPSEQLLALYDYKLMFLSPCLRALGVRLVTPPPTRADIIEFSPHPLAWNPYHDVWNSRVSASNESAMRRLCPIEPSWRRPVEMRLAIG